MNLNQLTGADLMAARTHIGQHLSRGETHRNQPQYS